MSFDIDINTNIYSFNQPIVQTESPASPVPLIETQLLTNEEKTCNMCHKNIKDCGLYSANHDLVFCDLICAKIYSDNIEKITIDDKEYRNNYTLNKLSKEAEKIYLKYKYKFFDQLPILIISDKKKNKLQQLIIDNDIKKYQMKFNKLKKEF